MAFRYVTRSISKAAELLFPPEVAGAYLCGDFDLANLIEERANHGNRELRNHDSSHGKVSDGEVQVHIELEKEVQEEEASLEDDGWDSLLNSLEEAERTHGSRWTKTGYLLESSDEEETPAPKNLEDLNSFTFIEDDPPSSTYQSESESQGGYSTDSSSDSPLVQLGTKRPRPTSSSEEEEKRPVTNPLRKKRRRPRGRKKGKGVRTFAQIETVGYDGQPENTLAQETLHDQARISIPSPTGSNFEIASMVCTEDEQSDWSIREDVSREEANEERAENRKRLRQNPTLPPQSSYRTFTSNAPTIPNFAETAHRETPMTDKQLRNHQRSVEKRGLLIKTYCAVTGFINIMANARFAETLWSGVNVSEDIRVAIWHFLCKGNQLENLVPIPYRDRMPIKLADGMRRVFLFRSCVTKNMRENLMPRIIEEAILFIQKTSDPSDGDRANNLRGSHWFCIAGWDRNSKKHPTASLWHQKNEKIILQYFEKGRVFRILTDYGCALLKQVFPKVAARYEACIQKMEEQYGIKTPFGLFFNFCLNGTWTNIPRVMCKPHIDFKNIALGVCIVFVYGHFNHHEKCWLVIWEAGVALELPPGVFVIYPSSLFLHFNVDKTSLKVVVTEGDLPTPENSKPLNDSTKCGSCGSTNPEHIKEWNEAQGRGSMVWFNQATLFQTAELGYNTVKEAGAAGADTNCAFEPGDIYEYVW